MNIERALKIEGWMSETELDYLASLASRLGEDDCIVEIGSYQGRSTRAMAENTKATVFAVDHFLGSLGWERQRDLDGKPEDWLFEKFKENMAGLKNIEIVRQGSTEAAAVFQAAGRKFSFIFIDATHQYESVLADIQAWRPLLRSGGWIAGHDYTPPWPSVRQAVDELIPKFRVVDTIWSTENADGGEGDTQ